MTHIRHYFHQRLGKDVWNYCIVPFLLPSRNSVYKNRRQLVSDIKRHGSMGPLTAHDRKRSTEYNDYVRQRRLYYDKGPWAWGYFCRQWKKLQVKGICMDEVFMEWNREDPITISWIKDVMASTDISYTRYHINPPELTDGLPPAFPQSP
jgi:hypothetical protein